VWGGADARKERNPQRRRVSSKSLSHRESTARTTRGLYSEDQTGKLPAPSPVVAVLKPPGNRKKKKRTPRAGGSCGG